MKRRILIKKLEQNGWWYLRDGGNHDVYTNGKKNEPVGRHREINENLAKAILKRNGIKWGGFVMKIVYPIVMTPDKDGILVSVPDCEINTYGKDLADALYMAEDAISIWCVCMQDDGRELPEPSNISQISHEEGEIVELVECNLTEYREMLANRKINKRITIPAWLNTAAKKANINFSQFVQQALKAELGIK